MLTTRINISSESLIQDLQDPGAYPHAVRAIHVVETHISWVILTGDHAYKIKKPVTLGFLDFSTLEKRKFYCEEELRVNRRTAPELYLDVVGIGAGQNGLRIGAEPALEYAVHMRQFPHEARLDQCLQAGIVGPERIRLLAVTIARFHNDLPPRVNSDPGFEFERAVRPARKNFLHLDAGLFNDHSQQQLAVVEAWSLQQAEALRAVFETRARRGFIRECHGDLHLENLLLQDDRFTLYDAIEFNANLRWIDTSNDIAFLAMDLMAHQQGGLAYDLLNAWLEETGDYESLSVMRFYLVYRAMVRAVVTSIRQQQTGPTKTKFRLDAERYVDLAADLVDTPPPRLYLMHGFSGSGKTWISNRLVHGLKTLRVRSDLERKRLPGLSGNALIAGQIDTGLYSLDVTDRTYAKLEQSCEQGLKAGFSMIADATFLRRHHRKQFFDLAQRTGAQLLIVDCHASESLLRERISQRSAKNLDASDADLAVLEHQLADHDELGKSEKELAVRIDSSDEPNQILLSIKNRH